MSKGYRVIFESYDDSNPTLPLTKTMVSEGVLEKPTSLMDFSMGIDKQIDLIKATQNCILQEKITLLTNLTSCRCCKGKLKKFGQTSSTFYDVFTDHVVKIQRTKCTSCNHEEPSTIRTIFNGTQSADLVKIQAELGSQHSFREVEHLFSLFSNQKRPINNHDRIKQTTERIGQIVEDIREEESEIIEISPAKELILNVDGGHVKTTEDKRSIEAMTSIIYRPENLLSNDSETRNYITSKHCAASVKDDNQKQLIANTIVAALKQGLCAETHLTALSDGADNCWNVIDALQPLAGSVTRILDWFHLAKKIKNISLPDEISKEKLNRVKWHLWRGNVDFACIRLNQLLDMSDETHKDILQKLSTYITNNRDKIVNYRSRKDQGLVFTSQLAESTVESLINQRCKRQQQMRWSREGLNPILQIRAAIFSDDWNKVWKMAVMNTLIIPTKSPEKVSIDA
jgi:hypothetical protein